ncbi:MAG: acylneuraminate cytidylyltransferase family protein [Halobacteriovoraceae bacterium]|nr:acylneuraminate cytidylyltransferase family protein [Halobacteriovoraceae bacterium]
MKRLCTICARGGSKGVKNKNLREFLGRPLIASTILQAKKSGLFDTIAVSSDSDKILDTASEYGVEILIKRPDELATDTAAKIPVIQHCLLEVEKITGITYNSHMDLDSTSPLRNIEDIVGTINMLEEKNISNILSATPARRSPYFNLLELDENNVAKISKELPTNIIRRQDSPKCYDANASIYAWQRDALLDGETLFKKDTCLFIMPEERSYDIDTEIDFQIVEFLAKKRDDLCQLI